MIDIEASIAELRKVWGQGPGIHKRPADLARYQHIIDTTHPQVIVETGLYYGGSQLWFAERVPHVINVELDHHAIRDYRGNVHGLGSPPPNGHIIEGHSFEVFPQVASLAHKLADGGPVMVILDSDHDTLTVFGEAVRYGTLVTPGSYLVIEDGLLHYLPAEDNGKFLVGNWYVGDPKQATERYLKIYGDDWEVDTDLEAMSPITMSPGGWLRRR